MNPIHTHIVENNTFKFFVQLGEKIHNIRIEQHTDFSNTSIAKDFPNGSKMNWGFKALAIMCKTEYDCINFIAPKILKEWTKI